MSGYRERNWQFAYHTIGATLQPNSQKSFTHLKAFSNAACLLV